MISDGRGNVLIQDRLSADRPGITFPGGHVEPGESFTASAIREVHEETGLTIERPKLCGIKQFQTQQGDRYVALLYRANQYSGTLTSSEEGAVFGARRSELGRYQLPADFEDLLKAFEPKALNEFYYDRDSEDWAHTLL